MDFEYQWSVKILAKHAEGWWNRLFPSCLLPSSGLVKLDNVALCVRNRSFEWRTWVQSLIFSLANVINSSLKMQALKRKMRALQIFYCRGNMHQVQLLRAPCRKTPGWIIVQRGIKLHLLFSFAKHRQCKTILYKKKCITLSR